MSYYRRGPFRPSGPNVSFGVPKLTPYVKIIIITCVAVWLVQQVGDKDNAISKILGLVPDSILGGFLWQPLTYMFLHSPLDMLHIVFNMLVLYLFGSELEGFWGSRTFLAYYLICGVGAGILATVVAYVLPSGDPVAITIGASGAIYGLLMAYGIVFANRTILFMLLFPMKARTFAWILFAIAFLSTLRNSPNGVSHVAHLGGAITGFLYLKQAWRVGHYYRELRWKIRRRKFKVMPPEDPDDRWLN